MQVAKLQAKISELSQRGKAISTQLTELHNNKGNTRSDGLKREMADLRHQKQQLLVWTALTCSDNVGIVCLRRYV